MNILLISIVIIMLTYIMFNKINNTNNIDKNEKKEGFTLYNNILDYLTVEVDNKVLSDVKCYNNDKLLSKIRNDPTINCEKEYENVSDIYYKTNKDEYLKEINNQPDEQNFVNKYYNIEEDKSYSFAELCPVTANELNSTLCLRKKNNDLNNILYRLDNIVLETNLHLNDDVNKMNTDLQNYQYNNYRLFNTDEIKNYFDKN